MNKERLALVLEASEGRLSKEGLMAIADGGVEDLDRFAKEVDVVRKLQGK
jgi:hypothetical protein